MADATVVRESRGSCLWACGRLVCVLNMRRHILKTDANALTTQVRGSRVAAARNRAFHSTPSCALVVARAASCFEATQHSGLGFLDHGLRHVFHLQRLELEKRTRQIKQRKHHLVAKPNLAAKGGAAMGICRR